MEHRNFSGISIHEHSLLRAEDGSLISERRNALRAAILIPILILCFVIAVCISRPAWGQSVGGRIAGSVKDATGAVVHGNGSVDGNIADKPGAGGNPGTFGYVTKAADPRIGQIAAKFNF